ncbi:MAG: maltokinase N-terminal cap-like domain-containing protein [Actinomycetales bacterium]
MSQLPPDLAALLQEWLPAQRWFPLKGREVTISEVGQVNLPAPEGLSVQHRLLAVQPREGGPGTLVQVPLVIASEPVGAEGAGLVGRIEAGNVYDGPHHRAYVAALLTVIGGQQHVPGSMSLTGHASPDSSHDPSAESVVLSGEQSNTSIIVKSPDPLMVKLFRVVTAGANPDVEVTAALSAAGVGAVARVSGWISGSWDEAGQPASGHLAVSAEFLPGSQDAWREAIEAAQQGRDFTTAATDLGVATARVHQALASSLGEFEASAEHVGDLVAQLRDRVEWARREVAALDRYAEALDEHVRRLARLTPDDVGSLQRVHGDYHLGQVLHSPTRGWILLDFEGEPLRPLADRIRPDVTVRDVVGMVRSFDYAAGFVAVQDPAQAAAARAWAQDATGAFLAGYREVLPTAPASPGHPLFDALLVDKALYEVVYETRNRPDWIDIPMTALGAVLTATTHS